MDPIEKALYKACKVPRTLTQAGGAYTAFQGIDHLQNTNESVSNWFEELSAFDDAGIGIAAAVIGMIAGNFIFSQAAKLSRLNRVLPV